MSKNLTLKGAAFGALVALSISAVAPASAAGLADTSFVSLAPTTGTAYAVVAGAGKTFSLTANEASSVAGTGRNVKFLVTDADKTVDVSTTSTGLGTDTFAADTADTIARDSAGLVTITDTADASADFAAGDRVHLVTDIVTTTGADVAAGFYTIVSATNATNSTFTFQTDVLTANTAEAMVADDDIEFAHSAWDSSNSFVVNSAVADSATDETLVLTVGGTTTRTVDVTAWVDANSDGDIDSTEYVSPTRTVTFKKGTEVTGTVTWTQPTLGDSSLVAKVATTPELNGSQMSANDISVKFTRQGSTTTGLAASDTTTPFAGSTAWNSTDKLWVATAYTGQSAANTPWAGLADTNANDVVFAGTYSARPYIGSDAIATAVSATVGSTQAADVKSTVAATVDNAAAANETAASATAVVVRTGKSLTVSAKIYDDSSPAKLVGAGIPVTATLSAATGTIKVNATATSDQELTDANGVVTFVVSTTSALATDAATLTIQAQNVSTNTAQAAYAITWDNATATLYDAAVANAYSDVTRSTTVGGSQSFSFKIADQFKQPLAGSYRLKVANTGRTVSTTYTTVTAGAATVAVADGAVGAGTTISTAIDLEKDVSGTWTAQDLTNDGNSDGAADTVTYTTNLLTQTDAITLDVDGATVYGSGTADDSDALAAAATVALDARSSVSTVPTYTNAVTVTGRVANATTAAVRAGALVTISGDSSILFSTGGVYAFGSITFVADASGEFSVDAYSTKAASDSVVTVTSNGVSATRKVTFTGAAARSGKSIAIDAPATVLPGRTLTITGVLTDVYGNPVDTDQDATAAAGATALDATDARLVVTYDGPGLLVGSLPVETDANGKFVVRVLLGTYDSGTATLTATYGAANGTISATDTGDNIDVKASKVVTVGAAPVVATAAASGSTGKFFASVTNAAGKKVVIKVSGKFVTSFTGTAAKKSVAIAALKGNRTVTIYVGGTLVLTKLVTIK
ncbi:hypothetical protein [Rhodoluna sp. KAS3]|uniref:beta strand repeat-containing protein n=1 Tax=Rhodoluna sp. KAS3 TaxID=942880 RepID=UPI00222FEA1C|nr:hypothetical protein [Rhodoluna sp. KAS3]BDS48540.1 hypothetical protein RKAS3_01170 [Rhodoluna sp. KAS3]